MDTTFERVSKIETKINLGLIDLEMLPSNSPDREFHDETKTIECNKFDSSRGDNREKEKDLKIQESREISTNFWKSGDKTNSGEYMLGGLPKKTEGTSAIVFDTNIDPDSKAHHKGLKPLSIIARIIARLLSW